MGLLVSIALLFISDFHDVTSCTIQGYVYRMHEDDPVDFTREDLCPSVRHRTAGPTIEFYSPHFWVVVIIPPEHGYRRFMYRWGAHLAHVDVETVPIQWGYVRRG